MKFLKPIWILAFFLAFTPKSEKISRSTCFVMSPEYLAFDFFSPISFEELSAFDGDLDSTQEDNLREWQAYYENKVPQEAIQAIVYQASANDLQKIRAYVQKPSSSLADSLKNNPLVKYWQNKADLRTIDYLYYAKSCEPHAAYFDEWSEEKRDIKQMRWLTDAGKKYYYEKANNTFFKLRFAYQAIRMAHYSGEYQKAIELYAELVEPLFGKSESIIRYWALAHKAGALRYLNRGGESAYLFSKVFKECPSKRVSSFLSFKIKNEQEWQKAFSLCQNTEEKVELYFLRSLDKNANGLEEMKNIYKIQPESPRLSLMLVREINKLESDLLSIDISNNLLFYEGYQNYPQQEAIQHLMGLKGFLGECLKEKQIAEPELWTLADGYLEYVAGNPQRALSVFADLKKQTKDKNFKSQIEIFELAMQISRLSKIDEEAENSIYKAVKAQNHQHLHDFMIEAFARLYDKQGLSGKAYLCRNDIFNLKMDPKLELIEALIILTQKNKLTAFEDEYLFPKIQSNYLAKDKIGKPLDVLLEMKATLLFHQDRIKEALAIYEQIPDKLMYTIESDPFQANVIDCQENCPPSINRGKYNRKTLALRILALKELVKNSPVDQAQYYFELGNAYYNMTHFGNSWIALDYFRSSMDLWYLKSEPDKAQEMLLFTDCSKAKYFYDRAMNSAISTGNMEMAAQSCYMAAKCEQNQYYLKPETEIGWDGYIEPNYAPENRRYFTRLKTEFKSTKYYDQLVQECRYFNSFVRR
ncbi:MAG: hypothetical protein NW226_24320 [Microscillaceae bacterium]|nr:hypothetical protein [Microscillaceae bacterium]